METLRILGLDVKLRVLDPESPNFGEWDENKSCLGLRLNLTPPHAAAILWHEILHVISDQLALDLTEKQVTRITIAQHTVMRENPELLEFLGQT